jgi:hypothetical protein
MFSPPENIIHTSNHQHTPEHDHTPVHICHIRRVDDREETRDTGHSNIQDCKDVYRHAESAEGEARGWERFGAQAFMEDAARSR